MTSVPATPTPNPGAVGPPRRTRRAATRLRTRLTAGLILVIPIWITVLLVGFVFGLLRDASLWMVEGLLISPLGLPLLERWNVSAEQLLSKGMVVLPTALQWALSIVSALLTAAAIYSLGVITSNIVGRRLVGAAEAVVDRLPIVKTIYHASKQVLETFAGQSGQSFQRVVLVPFPSQTCRSVAFVTGSSRGRTDGVEYYTVFIATTPNPTTGFVFVVPRSEVVELDWTIEEAVKVVMSGGVLVPSLLPLRRDSLELTDTGRSRPA